MLFMSDRLRESLVQSNQTVVSRVEVLSGGEVVQTIEGRTILDADTGAETSTVDGEVAVERATVRRSCTLSLSDVSDVLTVRDVNDLLVPLVNEVRLWRGLIYHDRTMIEKQTDPPTDRELVPLGTFPISKVTGQYPNINVYGFDRMWLFNQYRLKRERTIPRGTVVTDLMIELLAEKMRPGQFSVNIPAATYTTPLLVWDAMDEPGELLHDMAEAVGQLLYVDPLGTFTMAPEPSTTNDPVWTYAYGPRSVLMPWPSEEINGENAKNVAVVTGEPLDDQPPFYGEASNDDPTSATYVERVGELTVFQSGGIYTSNEQCELAAKTIVSKQGMSNVIAFAGVVNPALESGDCLFVESPHPRDLSLRVLADAFRIPLRTIGPQEIVSRARVVLS